MKNNHLNAARHELCIAVRMWVSQIVMPFQDGKGGGAFT